jgi:hypothetical protein
MYMQKGALDRYTQLAVRQQHALQVRVREQIANVIGLTDSRAIHSKAINAAVDQALSWFDQIEESPEMTRLREEAGRLGDQSNQLFGVRSEGYFNLEHDFIGLGWLKRQLSRARKTRLPEQDELLALIVDYENPGAGGYYDNLGTANNAPNVEFGYPYDHGQPYVSQMLDEGNRPSQRSMHFTQDEDQGVTLRYRHLDPSASYRLRLTLVRPWYQERYRMRMNQKTESIYADDQMLAKDVLLPEQMSDHFSFDIPAEATQDGELVIRLARGGDVACGDRVAVEQWRNSGGWGTLLSEAWLFKKQGSFRSAPRKP